jgi:hypothetical protein
MLDHATRTMHVKGPLLRGLYLDGDKRVVVIDFDPGVPVDSVWEKLCSCDKKLIMG